MGNEDMTEGCLKIRYNARSRDKQASDMAAAVEGNGSPDRNLVRIMAAELREDDR